MTGALTGNGFDADVIIAGASFAGLAVARELRGAGRVLLLDHQDIGAGQTSACGTTVDVLRQLDLLISHQQTADRLVLHIGKRTLSYPLPYPYCTFEYGQFCAALFEQSGATFERARVLGVADGNAVCPTPAGTSRRRHGADTRRTAAGTLRRGRDRLAEHHRRVRAAGLPDAIHIERGH